MMNHTTAQRERTKRAFGTPYIYVLAVIEGDHSHVVHRIQQHETLVGRGEEANFVIDDEEISKLHCKIRVEASICTMQDLGSLNGTLLNGKTLRRGSSSRLRHLDEIQIGGTRLLLLTGRTIDRSRVD
jgi:pSer/pThr/pTyr-binding forkhead associated (FHA) protein